MQRKNSKQPKNTIQVNDTFKEGCDLQSNKQYKEAIVCFQNCKKANFFEPRYRIACCNLDLGNITDAVKQLEELMFNYKDKNTKQFKKLCISLSSAYSRSYRETKNNNYLIKQKSIMDMHPNQDDGKLLFYYASYYFDMKDFDASINLLNKIQNENPTDTRLLEKVTPLMLLIDSKKNKKLSLERAKKELNKIKNSKDSSNLSILLRVASEHPNLINLNETPIISTNSYEDKLKEARLYLYLSMIKEAQQLFKNLIENSPEVPLSCRARINYAVCLSQKNGNYEEAIKVLLPIVNAANSQKINQDYLLNAYKSLAIQYQESNELEESFNCIKKGLEIDPDNPSLWSTYTKVRDNRNGSNHDLYNQIREYDKERFNSNHPMPENQSSKIGIESASCDSIISSKSVKKDDIIVTNKPLEIISSPKNTSVQNKKKKKTRQNKQTIKPKTLISYDDMYECDYKPYVKEVKVKQAPKKSELPDLIAQQDISINQFERVSIESDLIKSNETTEINETKKEDGITTANETNKFSCNRFILFAAGVAVVATSAALTATALMQNPGK